MLSQKIMYLQFCRTKVSYIRNLLALQQMYLMVLNDLLWSPTIINSMKLSFEYTAMSHVNCVLKYKIGFSYIQFMTSLFHRSLFHCKVDVLSFTETLKFQSNIFNCYMKSAFIDFRPYTLGIKFKLCLIYRQSLCKLLEYNSGDQSDN